MLRLNSTMDFKPVGNALYTITMNPQDVPKDNIIWGGNHLFIITGAIQRNWAWGEYECIDFNEAQRHMYFRQYEKHVDKILRMAKKGKQLKNHLLTQLNYDHNEWLVKLGAQNETIRK